MKTFALFLLCTVFALSTAKPSHDDYLGFLIKAIEKQMRLQTSSVASVQEKAGEEICQSATYSHDTSKTYVHVCESESNSQGVQEYCFVSNGLCCVPPSEDFPPTPVEAYTLKLSDQFSTSVKFYSAGGARGVCFSIENEDIEICSGCRSGDCVATRCIQNTVTGNLDSCSTDACICKVGFAGLGCCECDLSGVNGQPHYLDPVTKECKPYCRPNCPVPSPDGCTQCTVGYKPLDCCKCDDGFYEKEGICIPPECPSNLKAPCVNGKCTCKDGYLPQDCCVCAPGYYKNENNECIPPECEDNVDKCENEECTCKPGYLSPDCCKCAPGYYKDTEDNKCKLPVCLSNLKAPCVNGKCTCKDGYLPQDCCECAPGYYKDENNDCIPPPCDNVESCVGGVCTCEKNYLPPDCCDCEKDLYKAPDGTCLTPCTKNIVSCTRGVCTCRSGFSGDDCCTESCTPAQDIYFLIDATGSYTSQAFCQTQYSTQLMISALNPGSSFTAGTRLGVVMYPTLKGDKSVLQLRDDPRESYDLLNVSIGCTESVGKFNNLIDGFMNLELAKPVSPYLDHTRSMLTYPATAIELLNKKLEEAIRKKDEKADRRRVVVVITDGANDESGDTAAQKAKNPKLDAEVKKLREITSNTINIIAAGNDKSYEYDPKGREIFLKDLETIAGDNVVVDSDPIELSRKLIQKMIDLNAICKEEGEKILQRLQDTNGVNSFCFCMFARDPKSPAKSQCEYYCGSKKPEECRAPPMCPNGPPGIDNPWYVGSKNYNGYGDSVVNQDTKSELEEEILAVVEEILLERMMNNN